jgi:hypothetical protein
MAKPKLALIPAAQGSKFYSVLPSSGVGDFDFTRSGSATRINSQGLIESVANGVSRLNYPMIDGVVKGCPHHILEPQRTNLVQYSEDFSQSYWTKSGLLATTSGQLSPKGDLSAFKLVEDTSNGLHRIQMQNQSGSGNIVYSIFAKYESKEIIYIQQPWSSNNAWFNIKQGIVLSSVNCIASIENQGNGWYKCAVVATNVSSGLNGFYFGLSNQDGSFTYSGNGTSSASFWGAQIEQGSFPTSYIPNYGNAAGVTRSAETANGSGDAATFNDSEGVFMVEISALADDLVAEGISISDETIGNRVVIFKWTTTNSIKVRVASGGTNYFDKTISVSDITTINKIAIKYKQNDFSLWLNGIELETDTSGITPIGLSKLNFNGATSPSAFYGNTKQIQYYDSALTDSELETLTSWVSFSDMAEGQLYTIE